MFSILQQSASRFIQAIALLNGSREDVASTPTFRSRMARWLLAFGIISVTYQVYSLSCVPFLEREIAAIEPGEFEEGEPGLPADPRILRLFPEGAWERNNPKMLKTSGGMLLFQDYQPSDDGRLELKPCTVVVFTPSQGKQRPIILRAPPAPY